MIAMFLGYLLECKGRDGTGHILFGFMEIFLEAMVLFAILEEYPHA